MKLNRTFCDYLNKIEQKKTLFERDHPGIKFNDDLLNGYINYDDDNGMSLNILDFANIINKFAEKKKTIMKLKTELKNYQFHPILSIFILQALMV